MASQDLSTTGLEGCLPVSGTKAIYDWFLFLSYFFSSIATTISLRIHQTAYAMNLKPRE